MKHLLSVFLSFCLTVLGLYTLYLTSRAGFILACCLVIVCILAYSLKVMADEAALEPPRCNECGRPLEEGGDMYLEDDFVDPPKRPM